MKHVLSVVFAVMFVAASAVASAQAPQGAPGQGQGRQGGGQARGRGPAAPECTTLACDVLGDWERTRALITAIADAMPEDKFSFKPTPAQRSYAEQVLHIAGTDVRLLGTLGAKAQAPEINMKATSKAEVMAELRKSFDYGAAVIKEFSDAQLTERIKTLPFLGGMSSRLKIIYYDLQHTQDIYGQMVVYVRLNGITPPASNRGV
jgi:uncharacterized damage-inducible protein DinB